MSEANINELIAMYRESDRLSKLYKQNGLRIPKGLTNAQKIAEKALKEKGIINLKAFINDTESGLEKSVIIDEEVVSAIETPLEIKPHILYINPDGTVEREPWSNEQKQDYLRGIKQD